MPDRLMAGQLILVQFVVVRIHLGQQAKILSTEVLGIFCFTDRKLAYKVK